MTGQIVHGILASHTTLMNTRWDEVSDQPGPNQFRDALGHARYLVEASGAETVIIIGPNHFRGFWLDMMPTFTIGVGEVIGAGEHGTPSGQLPTDTDLAHHLLEQMLRNEIDIAFSARLTVDHGITHSIQYVVPIGMPVVPIVINSFAHPLPTLRRCRTLGESLRDAVATFASDRRVAVIASGGLSHALPFPDWRVPDSDDDRFLTRSWTDGRSDWEQFEGRRRSIVVNAPPRINEEFDKHVLHLFESGDLDSLVALEPTLVATAGNGANEIRNWIAAAAACGSRPSRTLAYAPVAEWLTGMGVATIEMQQKGKT